jgi:DNA polymerase-3 subunit alpha
MAALISSVMSTKDKVPFFAAVAEEMGIEILPPDVNESDHDFVVVDGDIRFGLDAVKGVGFAAVEAIKAARGEGGSFTSLWDFCERVDGRAVNKKAIEALIKCGAFGSTGASRKGMLAVLEQAQGAGQKMQQDAQIGQGSIFDIFDAHPAAPAGTGGGGASNGNAPAPFARPQYPPIPLEEFAQPELLAVEKESIGLFLSAHPLKQVREALVARVDCSLTALAQRRDKDWVTVGGIITAAKKIRTRNGGSMLFATLDDLEGSVEVLAFEKVLTEYEAELALDQVVVVRGRVDHKDKDKTCVVLQTVDRFAPSEEEVAKAREAARTARAAEPVILPLRLDAAALPATAIDDLKELFARYPGPARPVLTLAMSTGAPRTLRLGEDFAVRPCAALRADVARLLGPAALELAGPAEAA